MYWIVGGLAVHLGVAFIFFMVALLVKLDPPNTFSVQELIGAALLWEVVLPVISMKCICAFIKSVIERLIFSLIFNGKEE